MLSNAAPRYSQLAELAELLPDLLARLPFKTCKALAYTKYIQVLCHGFWLFKFQLWKSLAEVCRFRTPAADPAGAGTLPSDLLPDLVAESLWVDAAHATPT